MPTEGYQPKPGPKPEPPKQGSAVKRQVGTIDLTPKWVGVLPMLLMAFESGSPKGRAMALDELRFMAMVADAGSLTEEQRIDLMAKRKSMEAKDHGK